MIGCEWTACDRPASVKRTVIRRGRRSLGTLLCFAHASLCRAKHDRPKWRARYEEFMPTTHELKTWPAPFEAVLSGAKTHEIRRADRPFAVGDRLHLREWKPGPSNNACTACGKTMASYDEYEEWQHAGCGGLVRPVPERGYTGRELLVEVTHLSDAGSWGLPDDLCVMSIRKVPVGTAARVEEQLR